MKSLLGVLTLTKRIHFDEGVVPPGSYSSVRYLLTGDPALTRRSLWPWSPDPKARTITLKSLRRWKGALGKICRERCAIGFIGAVVVLDKAPFLTDGYEQLTDLSQGSDLKWGPKAQTDC